MACFLCQQDDCGPFAVIHSLFALSSQSQCRIWQFDGYHDESPILLLLPRLAAIATPRYTQSALLPFSDLRKGRVLGTLLNMRVRISACHSRTVCTPNSEHRAQSLQVLLLDTMEYIRYDKECSCWLKCGSTSLRTKMCMFIFISFTSAPHMVVTRLPES